MKRFYFTFVFIILICLSSCGFSGGKNTEYKSEFTVIMPQDDTVNGYKSEVSDYTSGAEQNDIAAYTANTSTKKFHLSTCYYAVNTSPEKIITSEDRDSLIASGYEPCKKCNP